MVSRRVARDYARASNLVRSYERTGQQILLVQAVGLLRNVAAAAVRSGDPGRAVTLSTLAFALRELFVRTGETELLDEAVRAAREAVAASSADDPRRAAYFGNLGAALWILSASRADSSLLDEAVRVAQDAVAVSRYDSPDRAATLAILSSALQGRYALSGERADLDAAITAASEMMQVVPPDHPGRALALSNLGKALQARHGHTGDPADREAAVRFLRQAVETTHADHPDLPARLSDLQNALLRPDLGQTDLSELIANYVRRYYTDLWGGRTEEAARREAAYAAEWRAAEAAARRDEQGRTASEAPGSGRHAPDPQDAEPPAPPDGSGGGGEGNPPSERFLIAQMPVRVPLSAEVSLLVRVSETAAAAPAAGSALLRGLAIGPEGAQVTVVVQAPYELAPLTALEQVIPVPASGDSPPVRFAFQARGLGQQRVMITAWAGGTFLAELRLELSVEQAGPYVDGPTRTAPVNSVNAEPGEVTLQVRFDGQRYLFQFLSQSYLFEPVLAEALTAQPSQAVERTIASLRAMATGSGGYSGGNARTWMEQAGVGLWNDMVPELIKEQFWLLRGNIKSFSIAAADDVIPWELLYPLARDHDDGFLVEQFPVMRRVYGQQRFRSLAAGETRYVAPSGSPPDAASEITAIRRILGESNTTASAIERLDVLLDLIESGDCGLPHFACHNTFTADAGGSAITMGGGPFVPMLLNKAIMRHTLAERHPLVFINACRSAGAVPEYTRMMGWAQGFMAAGAGAFAGTLWAVRSESAAAFAETFYGALTAGNPLGEACRQAREETGRNHDDPTWLAYSVYGDPAAELTLGRPAVTGG